MPNITPVWGLTYPCPGEVAGAAAFSQLNQDIEEALTSLDALRTTASNRPSIRIFRSAPIIAANNAVTQLTLNTVADVDWATNWSLSLTSQIAPVKGLYHLAMEVGDPAAPLINMSSESLYFSFSVYTAQPGRKWRVQGGTTLSDIRKAVSVVVPLENNEVIFCNYNPAGVAGNVVIDQFAFQARLIVPLP